MPIGCPPQEQDQTVMASKTPPRKQQREPEKLISASVMALSPLQQIAPINLAHGSYQNPQCHR